MPSNFLRLLLGFLRDDELRLEEDDELLEVEEYDEEVDEE